MDSRRTDDAKKKELNNSRTDGGGGDAREKPPWELEPCHDLARRLSEIARCADDFEFTGWGGATFRVKQWLADGWPSELIIGAFRAAAGKPGYIPPNGIKYFEPIVARFVAQQTAPLPKIVEIPAQTIEVAKHADKDKHSGLAAIDRVFARLNDRPELVAISDENAVLGIPSRSVP